MTAPLDLSVLDPSLFSKATELSFLSTAFSEFIAASATLETSYQRLQMEVAFLNHELAERNATLNASLAENQRVHAALEQIVHSMPCGILVVAPDGVISMINEEGKRLLDLEELPSLNLEDVSRCSGFDLCGFVARGDGSEDQQEFCKASDGERRWISVHDRSLAEEGSLAADARQTILILRDITTSKQVELEREQMRQATALSEVATILAHEIRNPLASLELFAGLIEDGGSDTSEWISHLRAGIRSLGGIVNNVLSLRGAGLPVLDDLELTSLIQSSVEFVRPIADEAGIVLTFAPGPEEIKIRANANAIQQVVLNVARNAIRHTKAGGVITVTTRGITQKTQDDFGFAMVEFSDTGSGIAEAHMTEIFSAGFSGDGSRSGLGLAVCRQILRQHGGDMHVKSKVGEGTTFYMEIPTL